MVKTRLFWVKALFLFIPLVLILWLTGCEELKEAFEGPTGPAGPSGVQECGTCHSDEPPMSPEIAQYENSVHANPGFELAYAGGRSDCSRCHSNEGFIAFITTGEELDPEAPTRIHCFTCHKPHESKDFTLRTTAAYTLENGQPYDRGNSNTCANCHHAKRNVDTYVYDGVTFTSKYWGPHHGPVSDMLMGTNGYEYAGVSYTSSWHTTGLSAGCVTCHMDSTGVNTLGGHSWNMENSGTENVGACTDCHTGLTTFDRDGKQTEISALMDSLRTKLIAAGLMDTTDHAIEDVTTSADSAGALWNYLFVKEDKSKGIHNYDYAKSLLESSISELP